MKLKLVPLLRSLVLLSIHRPRRHRFKKIVIKVVVGFYEWDQFQKNGLNRDETRSKVILNFAVSINVNS